MDIFEENAHKSIMSSVLGLAEIYDDFQEGNIGFKFKQEMGPVHF